MYIKIEFEITSIHTQKLCYEIKSIKSEVVFLESTICVCKVLYPTPVRDLSKRNSWFIWVPSRIKSQLILSGSIDTESHIDLLVSQINNFYSLDCKSVLHIIIHILSIVSSENNGKPTINRRCTVLSEMVVTIKPEDKALTITSGKTPNEIATHHFSKDIWVSGLTPAEVCDMYGGTQFDFNQLQESFRQLCPDYMEEMSWGAKFKSLQFASIVIFEIGPESRRVKKGDGEKLWKFRFGDVSAAKKLTFGTVIVSAYKNSTPPSTQPVVKNGTLVISVKQASLLATTTLCTMLPLAVTKKREMLTPLAGAIFRKDCLPALMAELRLADNDGNRASVIASIIASCQSGGHYLPHSRCHIAVCAALCATKNMQDRHVAHDIVRKTLKQYHSKNKQFSLEKFYIFCRYATAGIPADFHPSKLQDRMDEIQKLNRRALDDLQSTSLISIIPPVPLTMPTIVDDNNASGSAK